MKKQKNFGIYFWIHFIAILLLYTGPLTISWKIFLVITILYYLQVVILKGCFLTKIEFGKVEEGFYYHYLTLAGFKLNLKKTNFVVDCIPVLILILSIILQEVFDVVPLLNLF